MEVLFVSHKYPPATGGMEKQSFELIKGMSAHVVVHTLLFEKEKESRLRFFWKLNASITKIIDDHPKIEIIHFNDGLLASLATFHHRYDRRRLKKIVTIHGLDVVFPLAIFQKTILPRFNQFDHIIAVSAATAEAAISRGLDPKKVTVISNGVDHALVNRKDHLSWQQLRKFYPQLPDNGKYMITLGRPIKRKGISWLMKEVIPHMPTDFRLFMIGPFRKKKSFIEYLFPLLPPKLTHLYTLFLGFPTDQTRIRALLLEEPYKTRAHHLGKVPCEHLSSLLRYADAFLMPNVHIPGDMEGFGLVCLEASLSGTLVVAANIEGITQAIHDRRNGLLLPAGEAEQWVGQLKQIHQTGGRIYPVKDYSRYTLEHFSWKKMCQSYYHIFGAVLSSTTDRQAGHKYPVPSNDITPVSPQL